MVSAARFMFKLINCLDQGDKEWYMVELFGDWLVVGDTAHLLFVFCCFCTYLSIPERRHI